MDGFSAFFLNELICLWGFFFLDQVNIKSLGFSDQQQVPFIANFARIIDELQVPRQPVFGVGCFSSWTNAVG